MARSLHYRLRVRSYDLDSFGHVNNAVYLHYLEEARCDYLEQLGLSFSLFHELKTYAVVVRAAIDFKSPARYNDLLDIRGEFRDVRRTSFSTFYEITNETTGRLCAVAEMRFAFVDAEGRLTAVPEVFRRKMIEEHE